MSQCQAIFLRSEMPLCQAHHRNERLLCQTHHMRSESPIYNAHHMMIYHVHHMRSENSLCQAPHIRSERPLYQENHSEKSSHIARVVKGPCVRSIWCILYLHVLALHLNSILLPCCQILPFICTRNIVFGQSSVYNVFCQMPYT